MTLVAHLTELRNRVAKALLALLVATAVAFWWYEHGLGDVHPRAVLQPARRPPLRRRRRRLRAADHRRLRRRLHPAEGRLPRRRRALRALLAVPAVGVHHAGPQAATRSATGSASSPSRRCCSPRGAVLAYISLAKGLQLLLRLAGDGVVVALTAQDYIGFVLSLLVAFGVSFEVPLIAIALNLVGVLQLRGAARRAGAGSSSSRSSSPRSSRPPRTRSPCCSWPGR